MRRFRGRQRVAFTTTNEPSEIQAPAKKFVGSEGEETLTSYEAFLAMGLFVEQFGARAGDDLGTLLGDLSIQADGGPFDPAAWGDWRECVRQVKESARSGG